MLEQDHDQVLPPEEDKLDRLFDLITFPERQNRLVNLLYAILESREMDGSEYTRPITILNLGGATGDSERSMLKAMQAQSDNKEDYIEDFFLQGGQVNAISVDPNYDTESGRVIQLTALDLATQIIIQALKAESVETTGDQVTNTLSAMVDDLTVDNRQRHRYIQDIDRVISWKAVVARHRAAVSEWRVKTYDGQEISLSTAIDGLLSIKPSGNLIQELAVLAFLLDVPYQIYMDEEDRMLVNRALNRISALKK